MLLLPAAPGETSALLALLGGGEAWSTSALALALGKSQRTVQRALGALEETAKFARSATVVHGVGSRPPRPVSRRLCYSSLARP